MTAASVCSQKSSLSVICRPIHIYGHGTRARTSLKACRNSHHSCFVASSCTPPLGCMALLSRAKPKGLRDPSPHTHRSADRGRVSLRSESQQRRSQMGSQESRPSVADRQQPMDMCDRGLHHRRVISANGIVQGTETRPQDLLRNGKRNPCPAPMRLGPMFSSSMRNRPL